MNRQEAAKLITVMFATCPTQAAKLDERRKLEMVDAYAALLDDVPYDQANAALRVLLQTRTWMPSVAEIRATVLELGRGPVRAGGDAWGSVLAAVSRYGSYRTPGTDFVFDDPIVAVVVGALGWRNICLSDNQVADRARFVELYDKTAAQSQREAQAPQLEAAREARNPSSLSDAIGRVLKLEDGKL